MLEISDNQMLSFKELAKKEYTKRVAIFAKKKFITAQDIPMSDLISIVKRNIDQAQSYGLHTKRQILTYITAVFTLGEGFENSSEYINHKLFSNVNAEEKSTCLALWLEKQLLFPNEV